MATQNNGEQRIDIPPVPTHHTSSSSSNLDTFCLRLLVSFLFTSNVIQIVASLSGLWVSIAHEHPDNKIITWVLGYASGCAVMLPFLYFRYRNAGTLNPRQSRLMNVFWLTISCFFLVWFVFGMVYVNGTYASSVHGAPILLSLFKALLVSGCTLFAAPALVLATICLLILPCSISEILLHPKEKPRGTSTPDSLGALPTYKFKSKENGGRSGDEGGVLLATGTKKKHTLSGEDAVCCICLGEYADNDELRELPCCSHFFHVECVDKWLKIKASCPLCQSELGGAAT